MTERKVKRGANFVISEELFNDIISKALGFEPGSLEVWSISNQHYNRCVEVSVTTDDERFPEIPEGARFPTLNPIVESVRVIDGTSLESRIELKFKGFEGISI